MKCHQYWKEIAATELEINVLKERFFYKFQPKYIVATNGKYFS